MEQKENKKLEEAYSDWMAIQPIDENDRCRLSQRFTIDFNYNSNHIEGNTLTYGQTEILLLFGKVMGEADLKDCVDMKASDVGLKMFVSRQLSRLRPPKVLLSR